MIISVLFLIPTLLVFVGGHYTQGLGEKVSQVDAEALQAQEEKIKQLIGIVAKEMPIGYSLESKKAQAIIARTYLLRREEGLAESGELSGLSLEEMEGIWQEDFEKNYAVYQEAVVETDGIVMTYDGELIEPIYHTASIGQTRDGQEVYGIEVPYLKSVSSSFDENSLTTAILDKKEIAQALKATYSDIVLDENLLESQIQVISRFESGYINSLQVGNLILSGEEFRNLLKLSSSYFEFTSKGDKLVFTVKGIGNGVGLSKNGANELAKQGKDYSEILTYYFTGIALEKR
jgi:stage II sporulation protein D